MNSQYAAARVRRATSDFDWEAMDLKLLACSGAYVFDETHELVVDATGDGATVRAASQLLIGPEVTALGYLRAGAAMFPLLAIGAPVTFFLLAEDNGGAQSTWPLIAYYDDGIGVPFTPNGVDLLVQPDFMANRGWLRA